MRTPALLFAFVASIAGAQPTLERSSFTPGAVGLSGSFALVSSAGQPAADDGEILESGALAGLVPLAIETFLAGFAAEVASSGAQPSVIFSSTAEAVGAEFLLHRAEPFAGGWIAGEQIGTAAATGAGSAYSLDDPEPYTFGEAERRYFLETVEPAGGRTMIGPVSLYRDAEALQDVWTIL